MKDSLLRRGRSLLEILVRDSVLYFAFIALTYAACMLSIRFVRPELIDASIGFSPAVTCISANRIFFNLREAGRQTSPSSGTLDQSYHDPVFAEFRPDRTEQI
ncbi:hypothetical protein GALMADRAFT_1085672 [Galerina marginata CBS 339.88]|uniref:Uncharacterized protein n=1 Tax=Galerina marginata (strain CBS 339.88) TaxID=685588 RepID=A0A067S987_GALM3|nr:hypothetical protein GALMADRAFT_1085672 [Galerina marginata CBS 339.88]